MTGRERKTCKECKERCLIYHQWGEEEEEKPMSFFKILIGSSFSKFLTIMILGESASGESSPSRIMGQLFCGYEENFEGVSVTN
ncbi:hypothetical protein QJS10_CPA08g00461 [Acorus calamus]|uniref:Uncharacterized protein n=1 Tax=Acorus calamus TaxID=4465 RepID=A0AAV9EER3_ACOCL|nr:hypothetical protein QJS10_CPA08g00461 [Acorus calamus]